jgi:predicted MFS family arabinose efflux permease
VTLAVVAALYGIAAALLLPLAASHRRATVSAPTADLRALASESVAGVAEVVRNPTLRGIAVSYFLYQLSWGILVVAVPVIVLGAGMGADDSAAMVGVLWAMAGVAGGVGALAVGRAQARGREPRLIAVGTLVTGLAIFPLIALAGLPGLALGLLAVGAVSGLVDVGVLTLRQRRTDPARLGRVLAVSISVNLLGAPVGSALGGALLASSVLVALLVAVAAAALAALAAAVLLGGREAARGNVS